MEFALEIHGVQVHLPEHAFFFAVLDLRNVGLDLLLQLPEFIVKVMQFEDHVFIALRFRCMACFLLVLQGLTAYASYLLIHFDKLIDLLLELLLAFEALLLKRVA